MVWSKMKRQLESFLCPALVGRVEYRATGYRYLSDKSGRCYITVDKNEVFNMSNTNSTIKWYQTAAEISSDLNIYIPISEKEIEEVRKETSNKVPEERLVVIARKRKITEYGNQIITAQIQLSKSDFYVVANSFLTMSIEESLESKDILLNVLAIIDRRLGKKRILGLEEKIVLKHPIVGYFYELRKSTFN